MGIQVQVAEGNPWTHSRHKLWPHHKECGQFVELLKFSQQTMHSTPSPGVTVTGKERRVRALWPEDLAGERGGPCE